MRTRALFAALAAAALALPAVSARADEVDDLERKIRETEERIAQQRKKADEAAARAKELDGKARDARRLADEKGGEADSQRKRADREKFRLDRSIRAAEDGRRRIADGEMELGNRQTRVQNLENIRRRNVNAEQVDKLRRASQAQDDIAARLALLREILENDEPDPVPLAPAVRTENALVTKDATAMELADAYELAKEIEVAITESYKDIKATQTAIDRRMDFESAQQITDVARAVRLEADRAALEDTPRTKEALDAQKVAQTEVVREANNIVETAVAMMEEALEIVQPDQKSAEDMVQNTSPKTIEWMTEKDFEERDREEARKQRLEEMAAKAKEEAKKAQEASAALRPVLGALETPDPKKRNLAPGNVIRFAPDETSGGTPSKWMYVQDWYTIGPFPNPDRVNIRRKFPPESVVDLDATYVGKDGRTIRWEFMQTRNAEPRQSWEGDTRAAAIPPNAEEYGIWYAYAEVFCDVACERWIAIGSDDRSDVWINDVPVWGSSNKLKSWRIDEGYRRIRLERGRNRILARVENGWMNLCWSLCISLQDGELGL